jgi:hypothetical protein
MILMKIPQAKTWSAYVIFFHQSGHRVYTSEGLVAPSKVHGRRAESGAKVQHIGRESRLTLPLSALHSLLSSPFLSAGRGNM